MHKKEQLAFTSSEPDPDWQTDLISGVIMTTIGQQRRFNASELLKLLI